MTLDTHAPGLEVDQPLSLDVRTNSREVVVAGKVSLENEPEGAELTVGGAAVTLGADGTFQTTVTLASDGLSDILVRAVDAVGNEETKTIHVDVSTARPILKAQYDPATTSVEATDNSILIKGTTSPGVGSIEITQTSGGATVTDFYYPIGANGTFSIVRRLAEGQNSITLKVVDAYGNSNQTAPYSVSYKSIPSTHVVGEENGYSLTDVALVIAAFSIVLIISVVVVSRGFSKGRE